FEIQDVKAQLQDKGIVIRMYKLHTDHNQARTSQLPQDSRKTNKRVSFSTGVILTTSVSRPQLKSNPMGDRVMHNNSQGKKQEEVEDQHRNVKLGKNKTSVTACNDSLNAKTLNVNSLVEIVLFIVDSGCSKHMTGNFKLLINFVEKFLGTIKFRNDQIAPILGYGDPVQGTITIKRVYYVEGLNHNLFSVGQFCDADLDVAFRKSTCYIRDLKGNDLLTDHLFSSCELGKAKRKSFHTKITPSLKRRLQLLHMDLCGLMRVASINGKRYVLVIADDYSRYTWTHFLRSKDETPEVLIDFLRLVQRGLQAQVRIVRTDKGTEFLNQNLHAYFAAEEIHHQTSVARTPEQNGVVERRNRTLVEAARTMLCVAKVPLFFWAEAITTVCFTQNRSLVIPRHEKTPYHEKGDACIFVGYSTQSRSYRVFNKRTRVIMESIQVNFDELPHMASNQVSSDPAPKCQRMALEHDSLSPGTQRQENVPQADRTVTTSNELDLLFSLMFDELLNGTSKFVSKSSVVSSADAHNQCQHHTNPLNNHTTLAPTCQVPTLAPTVLSFKNINQAEMYAEMIKLQMTSLSTYFVPWYKTEGRRHHEAMADSAWIESMPEELHQFDRSDVWELVDGPLCTNVIKLKWLWKNKHERKTAFLYGPLKEEVYINQPDDFFDPYHPDKVYRLKKALYGLKQAPRAWGDILLVQIYVDDIIFGSTNPNLSKRFEKLMHSKFEMFMMGELKFFLGIQIHQSPRALVPPMATKHLDADLNGTPVDQTKYHSKVRALMYLTASRPDIMHATCYCARYQAQLTEKHLTADCTSMSSAEAEYVSLSACCAQVLWMRTQLTDYGFHFDKIPMYCDSKAAIAISCNPVQHSRTKHIDLADLFTKALPEERFKYLVRRLGMRCLTLEELEALANESA
nr:hypothetical protein [Tanacetum cinerariifolium]